MNFIEQLPRSHLKGKGADTRVPLLGASCDTRRVLPRHSRQQSRCLAALGSLLRLH